jgi:hypothetical protein
MSRPFSSLGATSSFDPNKSVWDVMWVVWSLTNNIIRLSRRQATQSAKAHIVLETHKHISRLEQPTQPQTVPPPPTYLKVAAPPHTLPDSYSLPSGAPTVPSAADQARWSSTAAAQLKSTPQLPSHLSPHRRLVRCRRQSPRRPAAAFRSPSTLPSGGRKTHAAPRRMRAPRPPPTCSVPSANAAGPGTLARLRARRPGCRLRAAGVLRTPDWRSQAAWTDPGAESRPPGCVGWQRGASVEISSCI